MKKLSFFSIPRNKTRKETIEVIKNALIANGWKFVEKSKGVRIGLESVQKSCMKNSHLRHSFATQFSETPRYKGF